MAVNRELVMFRVGMHTECIGNSEFSVCHSCSQKTWPLWYFVAEQKNMSQLHLGRVFYE